MSHLICYYYMIVMSPLHIVFGADPVFVGVTLSCVLDNSITIGQIQTKFACIKLLGMIKS